MFPCVYIYMFPFMLSPYHLLVFRALSTHSPACRNVKIIKTLGLVITILFLSLFYCINCPYVLSVSFILHDLSIYTQKLKLLEITEKFLKGFQILPIASCLYISRPTSVVPIS